MAKGMYLGVGGVARKVKKTYIGINGVARKIKKIYIGVGNVARLSWSSSPVYLFCGGSSGALTVTSEDNYNSISELLSTTSGGSINRIRCLSNVNGDVCIVRSGYLYKYNKDSNTITNIAAPAVGYRYDVHEIIYGNGYYVGIAYLGINDSKTYTLFYGTSLGGWNWFNYSNLGSNSFSGLMYYNKYFYHYYSGGYTFTKATPTNLSDRTDSAKLDSPPRSWIIFKGKLICSMQDYGNLKYCILDSNGNFSNTWNVIYASWNGIIQFVDAGNKLVAIGSVGTNNKYIYTSVDGITWSQVSTLQPRSISYEDGKYYAAVSTIVYESLDLVTWTQISNGHVSDSTYNMPSSFLATKL